MRGKGVVVVVALAAALVALGVVLVVTSEAVSFGWFAYAPVSGDDLPPGLSDAVVLTRQQAAGALVVAVGLVLLSAALGHLTGRSRAPRR